MNIKCVLPSSPDVGMESYLLTVNLILPRRAPPASKSKQFNLINTKC